MVQANTSAHVIMYALKIPTGLELNSGTILLALSEAGIESPDWKKIGKELGFDVKGRINGSMLFKEWQLCGLEMSWKKLAQALEKIRGYEIAASKARQNEGM